MFLDANISLLSPPALADQGLIPPVWSGSPLSSNCVQPRSRPPSRSRCAPSCYEPLCWRRRGAGGAAVAPRRCRRWWTWSTTPLSQASPRTANRSWWCAWWCCGRPATWTRCPRRKCWNSCTGARTRTELHRAPRCDGSCVERERKIIRITIFPWFGCWWCHPLPCATCESLLCHKNPSLDYQVVY